MFVFEYGLARLWMSFGVEPEAMIGHSVGEYVAACLSGVFSLEDALTLIAERGRLIQGMPRGAMTAVPQSESDLEPFLPGSVSVAATNGQALTVVSGPVDAIERFEKQLAERGVASHRLNTSHAFHSPMMEPVVESFREIVKRVPLSPPRIPFVSNLTGRWITDHEATSPDYWAQHLRHKVRFADGLDELLKEPDRLLLEVGPRNTLSKLAKRAVGAARNAVVMATLDSEDSNRSECESACGSQDGLGRTLRR